MQTPAGLHIRISITPLFKVGGGSPFHSMIGVYYNDPVRVLINISEFLVPFYP